MVFGAVVIAAVCSPAPSLQAYPKDGQTGKGEVVLGIDCGIAWSWTFKAEDDTTVVFGSCIHECEGKKHDKHETCDTSCDKKCPRADKVHYGFVGSTMSELGEGNDAPKTSHGKTLNKAY